MTDIPQAAKEAARKAVCAIPSHNPGYIQAMQHTLRNDLSADLIDVIVDIALQAAAPFMRSDTPTVDQLVANLLAPTFAEGIEAAATTAETYRHPHPDAACCVQHKTNIAAAIRAIKWNTKL